MGSSEGDSSDVVRARADMTSKRCVRTKPEAASANSAAQAAEAVKVRNHIDCCDGVGPPEIPAQASWIVLPTARAPTCARKSSTLCRARRKYASKLS
jgi:hypothetical protein